MRIMGENGIYVFVLFFLILFLWFFQCPRGTTATTSSICGRRRDCCWQLQWWRCTAGTAHGFEWQWIRTDLLWKVCTAATVQHLLLCTAKVNIGTGSSAHFVMFLGDWCFLGANRTSTQLLDDVENAFLPLKNSKVKNMDDWVYSPNFKYCISARNVP